MGDEKTLGRLSELQAGPVSNADVSVVLTDHSAFQGFDGAVERNHADSVGGLIGMVLSSALEELGLAPRLLGTVSFTPGPLRGSLAGWRCSIMTCAGSSSFSERATKYPSTCFRSGTAVIGYSSMPAVVGAGAAWSASCVRGSIGSGWRIGQALSKRPRQRAARELAVRGALAGDGSMGAPIPNARIGTASGPPQATACVPLEGAWAPLRAYGKLPPTLMVRREAVREQVAVACANPRSDAPPADAGVVGVRDQRVLCVEVVGD